ncbi:MAG: cysK3 [Pseudonocardia sp.]|nr:cysK3 [Pseudonocardia sp.]
MSVISVPQGYNEDELYVDLESIFGHSLFLKCEGFNFAGSIKLKAATEMVEAAERDGVLTPGSVLIEPSPAYPAHAKIGSNCTLGVQTFVHYGVTMGADSVLEATPSS